jgi:hypothetical protein
MHFAAADSTLYSRAHIYSAGTVYFGASIIMVSAPINSPRHRRAKACFAIKLHATPQFSFPIAPFAAVLSMLRFRNRAQLEVKTIQCMYKVVPLSCCYLHSR